MSPVADSALFDSAASELFRLSDSLKKMTRHHHHHHHHGEEEEKEKETGNVPVDIVEAQKEYIFFLDVPGLSKSDIQVSLEDEKVLAVKGGGKRKREEEEEEGCRYLRLERRASTKFLRKFRLPENANPCAITAKCECGVLTVVVEKLPPPPETKPKTVEVKIA